MVFSSPIFIFAFLPTVLAVYYLQHVCLGGRLRNFVLLIFSYVFYLYGAGEILLALALSTLVDYVAARLIDGDPCRKRLWLALSSLTNIGLLCYFKYSNFFIWELNKGLALIGLDAVHWTSVVLPIGISFFTFQKLSYIVDVYRGEREPLTNFVDLALYIAMFPQLIAGPIVRFGEISEQLRGRVESWALFRDGVFRFSWGFSKKVIVANACGEIADAIFGLPSASLDTKLCWMGTIAYTLQIYFDFSAYSDMAIGLGHFFGFRFPENFNRPYSAASVTDFWRRWHMTLSRWFRDYLYVPLGGSRRGNVRTYFNLLVVFILCGLWHGASGIFIIWGLYHGVFLVIERVSGYRAVASDRLIWLRRLSTLFIVMMGWVLFRADNLGHAADVFHGLFVPSANVFPYELRPVFNNRNLVFMCIGAVVFLFRANWRLGAYVTEGQGVAPAFARLLTVAVFVPYALCLVASGSYNPFIYFRF